jgi:hypothetical protein
MKTCVFSLWLLFLLFPFSGLAQTAKPSAPAEWNKILESANKEGKLTVSIPASAELRKALDENFKKKFPAIELELVVARGPTHAVKIVQEKKAGLNR